MSKFTILLSAQLSTLSPAVNDSRHTQLIADIRKAGLSTIVECQGVYKGVPEDSLAVPCNYLYEVEALSQLATDYEQESILMIKNETGQATLRFMDKTQHAIILGTWCKTSGWDCRENHDNYTFFPEANKYYVCR